MKKAVLLDVSAIMYRAFYSLINMRNSQKEPTGAVYGFTNILLSVFDSFSPDYVVACFDVKRSSLKRREIYPKYKEHRKPVPEDLLYQIPLIENLLDGFNIKKFKMEGYEADDLLGTLAKKFEGEDEDIEVYIVTGDKDLSQVLSNKIKIALLGKGTGKDRFKILSTDEDVIEQLGVTPDLIPDLFGLQGDASDGIPGVRGIGPKTAVKLINQYKNIEGVYENIEDLKGKMKEKLIEDKNLAFLSRQLAIIETDIDLEFNLEELKKTELNNKKLYNLLSKLDFRSLIKRLKLTQISDGSNGESSSELNENVIVSVINDIQEVKKLFKEDNLNFLINDSGIAASSNKRTVYIPLFHNYLGASNIDLKSVNDAIVESGLKLSGYDIKHILKRGYKFKELDCDVMLAYYLLNSDDKFSLDQIIYNRYGTDLESYKDKFSKKVETEVDIKEMAEFLGKRAFYVRDLKSELLKELKKENLEDLFYNMEMKLLPVLDSMEKIGIKIDVNYFKKFSLELKENIEGLEKKIYTLAGEEFNIKSPKQLAEILFEKLGIVPTKKTKTGYSTNVDVLEALQYQGEEIAERILEYRKYVKLKSTYVDALPLLADKDDKLHTTFNQTGTATGRLSSSDPNLQNIPVKTSEGIKIREGFIARDGYKLLAIDYSQIELRVLAEISKDKSLINAYKDDLDLHSLTASKLFFKDNFEDITREERSIAKIVNFSIIYGKTAFGLAHEIKLSLSEAKSYIDRYFKQYNGVKDFIDNVVKEAEEKGEVRTLYNRKRTIDGITSKNKNIKKQAERMAVNTVIQGTAADILKVVMIKLYEELKDSKDIYMNLQVHDELIFEVKEEKIEEYENKIKEIMENTVKLNDVFLKANASTGKRWSETK